MVKIGVKVKISSENTNIFRLEPIHALFVSGNMRVTLYLSIVDDTYYKCPQYEEIENLVLYNQVATPQLFAGKSTFVNNMLFLDPGVLDPGVDLPAS